MSDSSEQQAKHAASDFRRTHRLGVQPLGDLVALIEQATGYDVAILDAEADEHGLTMRDPDRNAVFIGVARSRNPMRQRSTLAHELGHVIFDDWDGATELAKRSPQEIRADAFARHLLIPIEGVRDFLGARSTVSEAELAAVVQRFLVSPAMAAIALRDAGFIGPSEASHWSELTSRQLAVRFGWSDHYASLQEDSHRPRSPQTLVARAFEGYREGVVSAQAIATLRSVNLETALKELEEAGVIPLRHDAVDLDVSELPKAGVDLTELEDEDPSR